MPSIVRSIIPLAVSLILMNFSALGLFAFEDEGENSKILSLENIAVVLYPGETREVSLTFSTTLTLSNLVTRESCGCTQVFNVPTTAIPGFIYNISAKIQAPPEKGHKVIGIRIRGEYPNSSEIQNRYAEHRFLIDVSCVDYLNRAGSAEHATWGDIFLPDIESGSSSASSSILFSCNERNSLWDKVDITDVGDQPEWNLSIFDHGDNIVVSANLNAADHYGDYSCKIGFGFSKGGIPLPYHPTLRCRTWRCGKLNIKNHLLFLGAIEPGGIGDDSIEFADPAKGVPEVNIFSHTPFPGTLTLTPYDAIDHRGIHASLRIDQQAKPGPISGWFEFISPSDPGARYRMPFLAIITKRLP